MSKKLEQTKGKIKLVGKVVGISDKEKSLREGFTKDDKKFQSISFYVQTSTNNRIRVEMFGMERDNVKAYSRKAKESKDVPWSKRHDNHGDYKVMGVNLKLEEDKDGKLQRKVLVEYDAVDYILNNLNEEDVIQLDGEIDFQQYENDEGEVKRSTKFIIKSVTKKDIELDFDDEDFKEEAIFEQEIVVLETEKLSDENKVLVNAKVVKYNGDTADADFIVDETTHPKLANNITKRFSLGDFIKVYGRIASIAVEDDAEEVVEDEDDWGGDDDIKESFKYITNFVRELRITSVDSTTYEKNKYNENDLFSSDEDGFNGNIDEDDFDEEDEEDLPFE